MGKDIKNCSDALVEENLDSLKKSDKSKDMFPIRENQRGRKFNCKTCKHRKEISIYAKIAKKNKKSYPTDPWIRMPG